MGPAGVWAGGGEGAAPTPAASQPAPEGAAPGAAPPPAAAVAVAGGAGAARHRSRPRRSDVLSDVLAGGAAVSLAMVAVLSAWLVLQTSPALRVNMVHAMPNRRELHELLLLVPGLGARELFISGALAVLAVLVLKVSSSGLAPPRPLALALNANGVASAAAVLMIPDDVLRTWLLATIAAQDALLALLYDGARRGRRRRLEAACAGLILAAQLAASAYAAIAARLATLLATSALQLVLLRALCRGVGAAGEADAQAETRAAPVLAAAVGGVAGARAAEVKPKPGARGEGPRSGMEVEASFRGAAWLCAASCAVTLSLLVALHRGEGRNADAASAWVPGLVVARSLSSLLQARALG